MNRTLLMLAALVLTMPLNAVGDVIEEVTAQGRRSEGICGMMGYSCYDVNDFINRYGSGRIGGSPAPFEYGYVPSYSPVIPSPPPPPPPVSKLTLKQQCEFAIDDLVSVCVAGVIGAGFGITLECTKGGKEVAAVCAVGAAILGKVAADKCVQKGAKQKIEDC